MSISALAVSDVALEVVTLLVIEASEGPPILSGKEMNDLFAGDNEASEASFSARWEKSGTPMDMLAGGKTEMEVPLIAEWFAILNMPEGGSMVW